MSQSPLNPHNVKGKGRPKETLSHRKGTGKNSTKRPPSGFEIAEEEERVTAVPSSTTPPTLGGSNQVIGIRTSTKLGL